MQVIFLGSSGFGGSARIMADCAAIMSTLVDNVCTVTTDELFHERVLTDGVNRFVASSVVSDAIGEGGPMSSARELLSLSLAETTVRSTTDSRVIVWAHYLFPYLEAALASKAALKSAGLDCKLWVTPAGSDIWQVAPQIPSVTAALLRQEEIDRFLTYSETFAREVERAGGLRDGAVGVFTPPVSPILARRSLDSYAGSREELGLGHDSLVLTHHSNMRPVKAVADVVRVASAVAEARMPRETWLLLAGPATVPGCRSGALRVRHLGLLEDVSMILHPSDVEINLSRHDSFNMSIAEAMAVGALTLTTDVAGVARHVDESHAGYVVPLESESRSEAGSYRVARDWLCNVGELDVISRFDWGQKAASYAELHLSQRQLAVHLKSLVMGA